MDSWESRVKTLIGSAMCGGSALFGAVTGDSPVVVLVMGIGGLALGFVGVYQRMQDGHEKRWRKRVDDLEAELAAYRSTARAKLDEDADEISELGLQVKELRAELRARECRWPDEHGRARCYGEPAPRPIESGETFTTGPVS
jgi:hypothetical protein